MVASSIDGAILVDWLVGRSMDWFLVRAWQNVRILILCLCLSGHVHRTGFLWWTICGQVDRV